MCEGRDVKVAASETPPDPALLASLWVVRVGGDDGELRPWHYIYVYSIESRPRPRPPRTLPCPPSFARCPPHILIAHKVFFQGLMQKSISAQIRQLVIVKIKLADFGGNGLLQNDFKTTFREIGTVLTPHTGLRRIFLSKFRCKCRLRRGASWKNLSKLERLFRSI
jgi:hypothetical protein